MNMRIERERYEGRRDTPSCVAESSRRKESARRMDRGTIQGRSSYSPIPPSRKTASMIIPISKKKGRELPK